MVVDTSRGGWKRALLGEHETGVWVLLFTLLGPPIAWSLHFLVIYFLVALYCTEAWTGAGVAIVVTTIVFGAISFVAGWLAYQRWRQRGEGVGIVSAMAEQSDWGSFILLMGLLGSILFTFLIVAEALPAAFVPLCSEFVG
jgi:nicotinamide riboside transporter PnuC